MKSNAPSSNVSVRSGPLIEIVGAPGRPENDLAIPKAVPKSVKVILESLRNEILFNVFGVHHYQVIRHAVWQGRVMRHLSCCCSSLTAPALRLAESAFQPPAAYVAAARNKSRS